MAGYGVNITIGADLSALRKALQESEAGIRRLGPAAAAASRGLAAVGQGSRGLELMRTSTTGLARGLAAMQPPLRDASGRFVALGQSAAGAGRQIGGISRHANDARGALVGLGAAAAAVGAGLTVSLGAAAKAFAAFEAELKGIQAVSGLAGAGGVNFGGLTFNVTFPEGTDGAGFARQAHEHLSRLTRRSGPQCRI